MAENYFGREKYTPLDVFETEHEKVCEFIRSQLSPLLKDYGNSPDNIFQRIKDICTNGDDLKTVEEKLNKFFEIGDQHGTTSNKLHNRAEKIFQQIVTPIKDFTDGKNTAIDIIDVGCGDGLVSYLLRTKANVNELKISKTYLSDTFDYRNTALKGSKDDCFILLPEVYIKIPTNGQQFDCVLLLTVLHHSGNPIDVIRSSYDVLRPNGIIIIIESCVGITREFIETTKSVLTDESILEDKDQKNAIEEFFKLSEEEQFLYGTFIDWFYNRALHRGVKVPFNFTTPDDWNERLSCIGDMQHLKTYCEGFDQETVPEFHTLHVFKKVQN